MSLFLSCYLFIYVWENVGCGRTRYIHFIIRCTEDTVKKESKTEDGRRRRLRNSGKMEKENGMRQEVKQVGEASNRVEREERRKTKKKKPVTRASRFSPLTFFARDRLIICGKTRGGKTDHPPPLPSSLRAKRSLLLLSFAANARSLSISPCARCAGGQVRKGEGRKRK